MRISLSTPRVGDYYPTVRAWCVRLGVTNLDVLANHTRLNERAVRVYVAAVCGRKCPIRLRRLRAHLALADANGITFDRDTLDARGLPLGTVLHECAHVIQAWRYQERYQLAHSSKHVVNWRAWHKHNRVHHGEPFCRTYARLLREVMT